VGRLVIDINRCTVTVDYIIVPLMQQETFDLYVGNVLTMLKWFIILTIELLCVKLIV